MTCELCRNSTATYCNNCMPKSMSQNSQSELIKKLEKASWTCSDCGNKYGNSPAGHCSTYHTGTCDVCGEEKAVTESRDFNYFKKTIYAK